MNFFVALLFTVLHTCVSLRFNEVGITQVVENVEDGDEGRRRRRRRRRRRKTDTTNVEGTKGDKGTGDVGTDFEPGKNNPTNVEFLLTMQWTDVLRTNGVVVSSKKAAFVTAIIAAIDGPVFTALGNIQGGGSSEPSIATVNSKLTDVLTATEITHFNKLQGSSFAEISHASLITFRISFPENSKWATSSTVLDSQYEEVFSDAVFMKAAKDALVAVEATAAFTEFCCKKVDGLVGSKTSYMEWESSMILGVDRTDIVKQKDADGIEGRNKVEWANLGFREVSDDSDNNEVAMGFGKELSAGLGSVFDIVTSHSSGSVLIRDVQVVENLVQTNFEIKFQVYALSSDGTMSGDSDTSNKHKDFYDNVIGSKVPGLRLALATAVAKDLKLPLLPAYTADVSYTGLECIKLAKTNAPPEDDKKTTADKIKALKWELTATFRYLAYGGAGLGTNNKGSAIPAMVDFLNAETRELTNHAGGAVPATYTTTTDECVGKKAPCAGKVITFLAGAANRVAADADAVKGQTDADGAAVIRRGANAAFTEADPNYVRVTYTVRLYDAYSKDISKKIKSCRDASAFDKTTFGTSLIASLAKSNLKTEWGITVSKVVSEPLGKIHVKTA